MDGCWWSGVWSGSTYSCLATILSRQLCQAVQTLRFLHIQQRQSNVSITGVLFLTRHHICNKMLFYFWLFWILIISPCVYISLHQFHHFMSVLHQLVFCELLCREKLPTVFFINLQTKTRTMSWQRLKASESWILIVFEICSTSTSFLLLYNVWFSINNHIIP